MTTKTILKGLGGFALTAGVGYLLYQLLKKQPRNFSEVIDETKRTIQSVPKGVQTVVTGKYQECGFPLKKWCGGENVKKLQRWLNNEDRYDLVVDGKFGVLTENAVIDNQMPFTAFKDMHPYAVKGQVSEEFFNLFIKNA